MKMDNCIPSARVCAVFARDWLRYGHITFK